MKHLSTLALLAAGASITTAPRAVAAAPRADASDPKALVDQIQTAFAAYKEKTDEQLKAKADDSVLNQQVETINGAIGDLQAAIDTMSAQAAHASLGLDDGIPAELRDPEYATAFAAYFRTGQGEHELKAMQDTGPRAALSKGVDSDGGLLAPVEWDRTVIDKLKRVSRMRQFSQVQSISGAGFKKVISDRNVGSGWVGETAARPATTTPALGVLEFVPGELYANPQASQGFLDDAQIDAEKWLSDEVETEFSRQEGIAFVSGDGVNKPYGLLTYATGGANAARHPLGAIEVVNSGSADALTPDGIMDLIYDLPSEFAANAKLFMNRFTFRDSRKLKDGDGNFLWQPSYAAGEPSTLAGAPVEEMPDFPTPAANALVMAYGDMEMTYLIIDRTGVRVLRDPYTNKPFVGFYTTKRVGGGVKNPEPMRFLKLAA